MTPLRRKSPVIMAHRSILALFLIIAMASSGVQSYYGSCTCMSGYTSSEMFGVVQSPGYPLPYCTARQSCSITIAAKPGWSTELKIVDFNTKRGSDYVTITKSATSYPYNSTALANRYYLMVLSAENHVDGRVADTTVASLR